VLDEKVCIAVRVARRVAGAECGGAGELSTAPSRRHTDARLRIVVKAEFQIKRVQGLYHRQIQTCTSRAGG